MSQTQPLIVCANCGRRGRAADAMEKGWRYHRNGAGELVILCALCNYRALRPGTQLQQTD